MSEDSFQGSSWIEGAKYDTGSKRLVVYIGKDSYECVDVPIEVWEDFKNASSKGQYFNQYIRGKYNHSMFS